MNIRTSTDIDHAIRAACDLHDDRGPQTGTRRPDRQRPPQTLLDAHDGDAGLDVVADDDRTDAAMAARGARAADFYFELEEPIRNARHAARLVALALDDFLTKGDGASRDTLDFAITGSLAAAEEVHRFHQAF